MKYGKKYYTAASHDGQVLLAACGPIFCFGPEGRLRWRYDLDSGINSLACSGDGGLIAASYLETAFLNGDGTLLCRLEEKPNFFFSGTEKGRLTYGTWDGFPVAFDEKGQERWVGSVYGRRAYYCAAGPDGQVVAVAHSHMPYDDMQPQQECDDEYVTCLNSHGKKLWMKYLGEGVPVRALAVSPAGEVWVGTSGHLHHFPGPQGQQWMLPMTKEEEEEDNLIPANPPNEWKMPLEKEGGVVSLAIAAGGAVAALGKGRVLRLQLGMPPGGHPSVLWEQQVESFLYEVVYDPVRDETWAAGRQLHCLGPDGTILWQYDLGPRVDALSIAPGASIILAASEDGKAHLIRDRSRFAAYYITGGRLREVAGLPPGIEALLIQLYHEDPSLRRQAAEELGRLKEEEGTEALACCLEREEVTVREAAAEALAAIGTQRAADLLLDALERAIGKVEEDAAYRSLLARSVGRIGGPHVVDRLIAQLRDLDDEVREGVALALSLIGGDEIVDRLLSKMESGEWDYNDCAQRGALLALGYIGGERAVEAIKRRLGHRDSDISGTAAHALGLSRDSRALALLVKNLEEATKYEIKERGDQIRSKAVSGLAALGDRRAIAPLVAIIKDSPDWLRLEIVGAMGNIGGPEAVEALIERLAHEKDEIVRVKAIEALGNLGDPRAVPVLIRALKARQELVPWAAVRALGKLGDQRAVEPLKACLKRAPTLAEAVTDALKALGDDRS